MTKRVDIRNWILGAGVLLPLITILLFGFIGNGAGTRTLHPWISGAAAACAEGMILFFMFRMVSGTDRFAVRAPFYIASSVVIGIYALTVLLEIVLFGYMFRLTVKAYLSIHLITFLLTAGVLGLVSLVGKYAMSQENKESSSLSTQKEAVAWIASIREQLSGLALEQGSVLNKLLLELEESFRYSDPITHQSLYAIEDIIRQRISVLEDQVKLITGAEHDLQDILAEETIQQIHEILTILMERNTQLVRLKAGTS
ncbi:MAG: hypothetical protein ACQEXX_28840 [Bacillota bacterium]